MLGPLPILGREIVPLAELSQMPIGEQRALVEAQRFVRLSVHLTDEIPTREELDALAIAYEDARKEFGRRQLGGKAIHSA